MTAERHHYAEGGLIAFDGSKSDSVPIVIHPGESWYPLETVEKYGRKLLEELTGGKVHTLEDLAASRLDDGEPS